MKSLVKPQSFSYNLMTTHGFNFGVSKGSLCVPLKAYCTFLWSQVAPQHLKVFGPQSLVYSLHHGLFDTFHEYILIENSHHF